MQNIVIDKPYVFVPPHRGSFWPRVMRSYLPRYLRKSWGIERIECRGLERLQESVKAGHGIVLAPNHCRPCDPMLMNAVAGRIGVNLYTMAAWHVFMQGKLIRWVLRCAGGFSVFREGMDRAAVNEAIDILTKADRPLVVFPEGTISRTNDQLNNLMEGPVFFARSAAKRRAKEAGENRKVVIHPVAIKYLFHGDLAASLTPVLESIEARLTWHPQRHLSLNDRIAKVGLGLLALKETEYLGEPQTGELDVRLKRLIDHLLVPREKQWLEGNSEGSVINRVKKLRTAILPDMISGEITETERAERWRQLADLYLAQQISLYPPDYIREQPSAERLLETVERYEEDITDVARVHRPMSVIVQIGTAIQVGPQRDRGSASDPAAQAMEQQLKTMLAELSKETGAGRAVGA